MIHRFREIKRAVNDAAISIKLGRVGLIHAYELTCLFYVHGEMSPIYETFSCIKKAPGK